MESTLENTIKSAAVQFDKALEGRRQEVTELGESLYRCPELGFKEFLTSDMLAGKFRDIGMTVEKAGNIPGFKATIDTGRAGPGVAFFGELDAIMCRGHAFSNPETGAAHACGHSVQLASLYGMAAAMLDSGICGRLCGKIHFIAVPAEEYVDIEYRSELKRKGIIRYLGGKPEFLHRGLLNDVDMAVMSHVYPSKKKYALSPGCNGLIVKSVRFVGKAAHAGGAPHEGVNALYAANLALSAINSLRETFREEDCIRVHPIITKGGDSVNSIPSDVRLETFVRGRTMEAIIAANERVDRAIAGSALAMGAKVEITVMPGYYPLLCDSKLQSLSESVMAAIVGSSEIEDIGYLKISTDLGDLSSLMPVMHAYTGGVSGGLHSEDFSIPDGGDVYIFSSSYLGHMAVELLSGDAGTAKEILKSFRPDFRTREEYFKFVDGLHAVKTSKAAGCLLE